MPGGKESATKGDFLCLDLFLGFRCLKIEKKKYLKFNDV